MHMHMHMHMYMCMHMHMHMHMKLSRNRSLDVRGKPVRRRPSCTNELSVNMAY